MSNNLLARFAESIFWLARYMERIENLARVLDVTETHARTHLGNQDWATILEINSDHERFSASNTRISGAAVIYFYLLERDNPTSIASAMALARESARTLRHVISTEMWSQINMLNGRIQALRKRDVSPAKLSGVCAMIKEGCQAHAGITEGTLYRDAVWCFYQLGKAIERCDQTSRLVDIGYRRAMISLREEDARIVDSQLNTMLRSAAGYQAFRRRHTVRLHTDEVVDFLLFDSDFPRAMMTALNDAHATLLRLEGRHHITTSAAALKLLSELRLDVLKITAKDVLDSGLHGFIDDVQQRLIACTDALGSGCFGHSGGHGDETPEAAPLPS